MATMWNTKLICTLIVWHLIYRVKNVPYWKYPRQRMRTLMYSLKNFLCRWTWIIFRLFLSIFLTAIVCRKWNLHIYRISERLFASQFYSAFKVKGLTHLHDPLVKRVTTWIYPIMAWMIWVTEHIASNIIVSKIAYIHEFDRSLDALS